MTMRYTKLLWTVALGVVCGCAAFAQNMFLNDRQQFVGTATITITGWGSANEQANVSSPPFSGVAGAGLFAINPPQQGTGYVACVDLANTINFGSTYAYEVWLARGRAGALAVLYDTITGTMPPKRLASNWRCGSWYTTATTTPQTTIFLGETSE